MSVYKPKGSPHFHYDFQFKGVRHYGSTGCVKHTDALEFENAERTKVSHAYAYGKEPDKASMTVRQAFDRYYQEVSEHRALPSNDLFRLISIATALGPDLQFAHITDDKVALMVAKLRARTVITKRGSTDGKAHPQMIANATVNRYTECLRRAWRRAARVWKIACADEPLWNQHLLPEATERVRDLTEDEETRLMKALRVDFHPIAKFALMSGLRLANLRRLTWKEIDFANRSLTIKVKSKKQGGENHTIPLTTSMITMLANLKGQHPIFVFTYECHRPRTIKGPDGKITGRRKGERYPFSLNGWRKVWTEALATAKIEDFRFHDTRHTAATRTLRASGNLKVVQKMLGHTDITTTARYAHALTDDIRAAMEQAQAPDKSKNESRNSPSKQTRNGKKSV